jgi:hypothetical protein
MLLRKLLNDKK